GHTGSKGDWSSDVCSSDLEEGRDRFGRSREIVVDTRAVEAELDADGSQAFALGRVAVEVVDGLPFPARQVAEAGEHRAAHIVLRLLHRLDNGVLRTPVDQAEDFAFAHGRRFGLRVEVAERLIG